MATPNLYKKKSVTDVKNRTIYSLSADEKNAANLTVSKFFELFKAKHLS